MTNETLARQAEHFASLPAEKWPGGADANAPDAVTVYGTTHHPGPPQAFSLLLAGNGPTVRARVTEDGGMITASSGWDPPVTQTMKPETAAQVFRHYARQTETGPRAHAS